MSEQRDIDASLDEKAEITNANARKKKTVRSARGYHDAHELCNRAPGEHLIPMHSDCARFNHKAITAVNMIIPAAAAGGGLVGVGSAPQTPGPIFDIPPCTIDIETPPGSPPRPPEPTITLTSPGNVLASTNATATGVAPKRKFIEPTEVEISPKKVRIEDKDVTDAVDAPTNGDSIEV